MRKFMAVILMLICCVSFAACGEESGTTGDPAGEDAEAEEVTIPYDMETEYGNVQISNIYLVQEKTEHGYEGILALELDFTDMDSDDWYWADKEFLITAIDGYKSYALPLRTINKKKSEIGSDGKKYYFLQIEETKEGFEEYYVDILFKLRSELWIHEPEIYLPCASCEIVEQFPEEIQSIFDATSWR